jgi:hypothetical protein
MARDERDPRGVAGAPPGPGGTPKVTFQRGADGKFELVRPEGEEPTPETRAEARPEQPDDPRPTLLRNIPPYGA